MEEEVGVPEYQLEASSESPRVVEGTTECSVLWVDDRRLWAGLGLALAPVTMRLRSAKYRSRSRNWQGVLPVSQASQRGCDLTWTHLIFLRRLIWKGMSGTLVR
jgi:hypothetical protein